MKKQWLLLVTLIASVAYGQDIKVDYDKDLDFTQFKTFRFGECEVITPKDQQVVRLTILLLLLLREKVRTRYLR